MKITDHEAAFHGHHKTCTTYYSVRIMWEKVVSRAFFYHIMYGKRQISPHKQSICGKLSMLPHNRTGSR